MNEEKLKVLVCGCGSIGKRHIRIAKQKFACEVIAFDPLVDCRNSVMSEFDIEVFADEAEAFNTKPDIVIVAGPTFVHTDTAQKAINAGAHVFIEKPISNTLNGLDSLINEAKELFIGVGSNMRFYPGPALLKQNLHRLGKIYYSKATVAFHLPYMRPGVDYRTIYAANKSQGGGVILDAIHEIDYHLWFFDQLEDLSCQCAHISELEMDVEDFADISLTFSSGVKSHIHMDYITRCRTRSCEIVGENGVLLWQERGKPVECSVKFYDDKKKAWEILFESDNSDYGNCYVKQFNNFLNVIAGGNRIIANGTEGMRSLEIALLAKESAEKNKTYITF